MELVVAAHQVRFKARNMLHVVPREVNKIKLWYEQGRQWAGRVGTMTCKTHVDAYALLRLSAKTMGRIM